MAGEQRQSNNLQPTINLSIMSSSSKQIFSIEKESPLTKSIGQREDFKHKAAKEHPKKDSFVIQKVMPSEK